MGVFFIVALAATFNLVSVQNDGPEVRNARQSTAVVSPVPATTSMDDVVAAPVDVEQASTIAARPAPVDERLEGTPRASAEADAEPRLDFGDGPHYLHPTEVAEFAR